MSTPPSTLIDPADEHQRKLLVEAWLDMADEARAAGDMSRVRECKKRAAEFWTDEEHARFILRMIAYHVIVHGMDIKLFRADHDRAIALLASSYMTRKTT